MTSQGDHNTFGTFPEHLQALLSHALPANVDVAYEVYPKFETRGDLRECVGRFRDWWVSVTNCLHFSGLHRYLSGAVIPLQVWEGSDGRSWMLRS